MPWKDMPSRTVLGGGAWRAAPAILAGALLLAGCVTLRSDDPWVARDKAKHFGISTLTAAGVAGVAAHNGAADPEAMALGFAFTMSLGVGKEWYDRDVRRRFWSWKDLAWDLAGAAVGGTAGLAIAGD